jgi:nucleoside-diphosphate-sugar epimerase
MAMSRFSGKRAVVTGGAGFIGSHIAEALLKEGASVTIVDNLSTGDRANLSGIKSGIEFVNMSIVDTDRLTNVFKGASIISHQAAVPSVPKSVRDPLMTHESNATGTLSVFQAAVNAGVKRVVFASSSSVYGDAPILPKIETMEPKPLSPYAVQKLMGERYAAVYASLQGLETIGLRYFNVFGPRQKPDSEYAAFIPKCIQALASGSAMTIYGNAEQTRDFTYVENVVEANLKALASDRGFGESYNIACGTQISLKQVLDDIASLLGADAATSAIRIVPEERPGDIKDSFADISKAREALGYEPAIDFKEGLQRTIAAMSAQRT